MELAALIIVAGAAAGLAAITYAGLFAVRRWWTPPWPAYWFAIAAATAGALAAGAIVGGWGANMFGGGKPIAIGEVLPYIGTIRAQEPDLYERIETSVIRDQQEGIDNDKVRSNARALVTSYVADKTVLLPDDLTYELYATARDMLAYLGEHGDDTTCADLALGRIKGDIDAKLSRELVDRNNNNTLRVITAKANQDAPHMPAEEFSQFAADAFANASQATGVPPEEVDALLAGKGDPAKTCKLMKAFFDAMLAHPVEVAAAALRTLASGERATTTRF